MYVRKKIEVFLMFSIFFIIYVPNVRMGVGLLCATLNFREVSWCFLMFSSFMYRMSERPRPLCATLNFREVSLKFPEDLLNFCEVHSDFVDIIWTPQSIRGLCGDPNFDRHPREIIWKEKTHLRKPKLHKSFPKIY
jgi:hypothetical protein